MKMKSFSEHKLGLNKGAPRLWLEGRRPANAGFLPGARYSVEIRREKKAVVLRVVTDGHRVVAGKTRNGKEVPIIDINSCELLEMFAGMEKIRVIARDGELCIVPLASEMRKRERLQRLLTKLNSNEPLKMGTLSHGGGILSLATHEGMAEGGVATKLSFANDIRGELLDHAAQVNPEWSPETIAIAAPMQEVAFDAWTMDNLPKIDLLVAGLPCEAASLSGRSKNGTACAEAHEDVGHLAVAFLAIIAKLNPAALMGWRT